LHKAIDEYREILNFAPDQAEASYNLGLSYDKNGRFEEAIHYYNQAIRAKPEYPAALSNMGVIYGKMGRFEDAIIFFKKALKTKPDDTITLFNLGLAYEELAKRYAQRGRDSEQSEKHSEMIAKAIETYDKILELDPHHLQAARQRSALILSSVKNKDRKW